MDFFQLFVHKLVEIDVVYGIDGIFVQYRIADILRQCGINAVIIPTIVFVKKVERKTLVIVFKQRLDKRFCFFARRKLPVQRFFDCFSFLVKTVGDRIGISCVHITHLFIDNDACAFHNATPSGQIRFAFFGRNKFFPIRFFHPVKTVRIFKLIVLYQTVGIVSIEFMEFHACGV